MVARNVGRDATGAITQAVTAVPEAVWVGDFRTGALPSGMAFGRASDGGYFNAAGLWQVAGADTPRFDHDPHSGILRGLLMEEARTNHVRNSSFTGSVNGKLGSGSGVLPTNWAVSSSVGANVYVVGTGVEFGLPYMELKFDGTPGTGNMMIRCDGTMQMAATAGQTWTGSCFMRLTGGSMANVDGLGIRIEERNSSGGAISFTSADSAEVVDDTLQPLHVTRTLTNANTAYVLLHIRVRMVAGPVDVSFRVYGFQLEQGAFPTSYIATSGVAATRAADGLSLPVEPMASGTLVAEAMACSTAKDMDFAGLSDGSAANGLQVGGAASGSALCGTVTAAGAVQASLAASGAWAAMVPQKAGLAWQADDFALAAGDVLAHDAGGGVPVTRQIDIGQAGGGGHAFCGWIRRVALLRGRLENGRMQYLVKG